MAPRLSIQLDCDSSRHNCCRITDWLFISGSTLPLNKQELKDQGIKYIIDCTTRPRATAQTPDITTLCLKLKDSPDQTISQVFGICFDVIECARARGAACLVHCTAGVSRSPAIVIAYLMRVESWSLLHALAYVRSRRPQASPNSGFMSQLAEYEQTLCGKTSLCLHKYNADRYAEAWTLASPSVSTKALAIATLLSCAEAVPIMSCDSGSDREAFFKLSISRSCMRRNPDSAGAVPALPSAEGVLVPALGDEFDGCLAAAISTSLRRCESAFSLSSSQSSSGGSSVRSSGRSSGTSTSGCSDAGSSSDDSGGHGSAFRVRRQLSIDAASPHRRRSGSEVASGLYKTLVAFTQQQLYGSERCKAKLAARVCAKF